MTACGSAIVTVNLPSGSTLQYDTWLWDDMPLNSPKRPPYCNSTSGFDFDHITAVDMSFCTSLRIFFIQIGQLSAEDNDVKFQRRRILESQLTTTCDLKVLGSILMLTVKLIKYLVSSIDPQCNKKLSYRREAARCLVLLSILVSR